MNHEFQYKSAREALKLIKSGDRLFIHGSAATPTYMVNQLAEHGKALKDVEVVSISVFGDFKIAEPEYADNFKINSLFVSTPIRKAVNEGRADYIPIFL